MRPNKLRELLRANKPTLATHIHTTWPSVIEAIGHTGLYDYVEFVGEYGPYDLHDLDNMCRAADLYNMSMMLKVDQEPRGFLAQRAIGSGFHSILFADCRSAADVRECVRIVPHLSKVRGWTITPSHFLNQQLDTVWLSE